MIRLVIIRHGESEWNRLNQFTGWVDVELSEKGEQEAHRAGVLLREQGFDFDVCFTSYLKRAIRTQQIILQELDREWLPVIKSYKLNERHYGALQGLNKQETAHQYGDEQVKIWRRSYSVRPPLLSTDSPYNPKHLEQYREVSPDELPLAESLADTVKRCVPYFEQQIIPLLRNNHRVLISAHGNSLRALMKHLEHISDEDIVHVEIPTGSPLVYEFDEQMVVLRKYYLTA